MKKTNKKLKEINKSLKQVKETVQDLKTEMEVIKKTQSEEWLDMENLGKLTGTTDTSITIGIQEVKERTSGV